MLKHYVAVVDGKVVGSRTTTRHYAFAVAYKGAAGWFATFHSTRALADKAVAEFESFRHLEKRVVETIETRERVAMGAEWREDLRAVESEEGEVWR